MVAIQFLTVLCTGTRGFVEIDVVYDTQVVDLVCGGEGARDREILGLDEESWNAEQESRDLLNIQVKLRRMGCTWSGLNVLYGAVGSGAEVWVNKRRFRIQRQLGEGGFAFVYLVREQFDEQPWKEPKDPSHVSGT